MVGCLVWQPSWCINLSLLQDDLHTPEAAARRDERLQQLRQQEQKRGERIKDVLDIEVGDWVHIRVPDVDRAPLGSPTLVLLVIEHHPQTGMSRLASKHGVLSIMMGAEQIFQKGISQDDGAAEEVFALWLDDRLEKKSFRQLVAAACPFGGQGKSKCMCKKGCKTQACKCRQAGFKCNSACHCNKLGNCSNLD